MNSGAERDRMICGPRTSRSMRSMIGAHAVADAQVFLRDHLVALQARLDAARLDDHVALVHALDGADEDLLAARHEVVEQLLALGVADLLQDHLLGGLRADAADRPTRAAPRCSRRPRCRGSAPGPRTAGSRASGSAGRPRRARRASGGRSRSRRCRGRSPRGCRRRSLKRFLVAEASAISTAPNTTSWSTFFSRASASTSISNSRLM